MAEFLNKHRIYVFAHDLVGHGQSEGDRVHVDFFQEYVDDAFLHADKIKKDFPNTPMFVLGYSMGGLISIAAANQRPDLFNGVVLMAPLITVETENLPPAFVVWLGRMISKVIPQFPMRGLDSKAMSRDKEIATTMLDARAEEEKTLSDIEWPFLILHGEPDTLTSVNGSKLMYEKAKSKDKQLKVFPDALHLLHLELEPVKSETLNLIASWIVDRSGSKPKL